jgi:WD40 repeat protein
MSVGGVVLWDVGTHKRLTDEPLPVKEGKVRSVAFSPDGEILAAEFDGPRAGVVLWDVAIRRRLADQPLAVEDGRVWSVSFSPDGKTLGVGYSDGGSVGVVLWDVDLDSWQRLAGRIGNRNFTGKEWRQYFPDEPYRATFPDLPIPPEFSSNDAMRGR